MNIKTWQDRIDYGNTDTEQMMMQAEIDELRAALQERDAEIGRIQKLTNALLHQIDIGDFVDSNGHSAKMLSAVHDLMRGMK